MLVKLSATPDFKFKASNDSGAQFDIGASKSIGGDESGFRPMQLVLAAVGSCSGIDIISILKKSRQDIQHLDVEVEGERADAIPSPFTKIHVKFIMQGKGIELAKAEKAVSLGLEKYCSVATMLVPGVQITSSIEIHEV